MKNQKFNITLNPREGTIASLILAGDCHGMNWCSEHGKWGFIHNYQKDNPWGNYKERYVPMSLLSFEEGEDFAASLYSNGVLEVKAERTFDKDGNLREKFTFKNLLYAELFLNEDSCSVEVPFDDRYTYADDCMINRCNAHIWCGENTSYINALKMGVSENNLGLVVTRGALNSYSVEDCETNCRGRFLLNLSNVCLSMGEEYVLEWVIFPHAGKDDFRQKAAKYRSFIDVSASHYTVFSGEKVSFSAKLSFEPKKIRVYDKDGDIDFAYAKGLINVCFKPKTTGEKRIYICADDIKTYAEFSVKEDFETILEKRIDFIVDNQQFIKEGSSLDGAFLIYDNNKEHMIFDNYVSDHNASRERTGMALLIARYLRTHKNEKFLKAIKRYDDFVNREIYSDENGYVYNTVGRGDNQIRLYNAPWVSMFFTEMYYLTKDKTYLKKVLKLFEVYYDMGGQKFYPNGISVLMTANAFKDAGMSAEYDKIYAMFKIHVDNMVKNGISYPKHEVNYEQTIVSPAATFLSEFALLSGDKLYAKEAKRHILNLERFSGNQPSFHMNEIPIRYWDDWWFGNLMLYGDNFPHYWSCLSARSYVDYYRASGEMKYAKMANECIRNCLCLFTDDARGSAAYVYPYKVNGAFGEKYDNWANDQDFALYFAIDVLGNEGV